MTASLLDCPTIKSLFALPVLGLIYVIGRLHSHIRHPSTVPPTFARLAAASPPLGGDADLGEQLDTRDLAPHPPLI